MIPRTRKSPNLKIFKADTDSLGVRLDVFVSKKYPSYTRSSLANLFNGTMVKVNGKPARASYKLRTGDKVEVDESLLKVEIPKVDLPIIYEDENVIVINKPAGVLTHAKGSISREATVASFIKPRLNDKSLTGNRAGIVHRLDRGTSGVIICAKNKAAQLALQKQFSQRKVKKIYLAIVDGMPDPESAIIDVPIARNMRRPQTFKTDIRGKSAQTKYTLVKSFERGSKPYSLVKIEPLTGRTHQIRVHMKYIGHPITGDPVYGNGLSHVYLHASSLEVTLPGSKRRVFKAPEPDYFKEFIGK